MSINISVLGPEDIVGKIVRQGEKIKEFQFNAYPYKDETETMELVNKCIEKTDILLFTGPIPYYIARKNVEEDIPMLYVSYSGTAFYKTIFEYLESINWDKSKTIRFSIDTVQKRIVHEMLDEFDINHYKVYAKDYKEYIDAKELVEYHYRLFKEGQIDFAITCLTSAYKSLKSMGVPVYRIVPTTMSIRETLRLTKLEAQNIISKDAQLCVGVVKVLNWDSMDNYSPSEYEQRRMKLTMTELFINFCESIKASMKFENDDEYIFYATRGAIENVTNFYRYVPLIQDVNDQLPFKICIGLGYGYSANEAEKNSREALKYAKDYDKNSCYVIMEDGKVKGPLGAGRTIEFYSRINEPEVIELIQKSNVSATTLNKIIGIQDSIGKDTLTANDIAESLNITLRSARRILNNLEESGIAKVVGEEQLAGRGRPRQIYRILV